VRQARQPSIPVRSGELRRLPSPHETERRTKAKTLAGGGGGQKRRRADDDAKELNSSGTLSENFTHLVVGNFYKLYRSNHRRLFLTY
jgi:hypothetical protein